MSATSIIANDSTRSQLEMRSRILAFESRLRQCPGAWEGDSDVCPLTHEFPPGLYVRTIRIPAGTVLTGKLHRHEHPNILRYGTVRVATEFGGVELLRGPMFMISKGLTKRALVAITDLVWTTIHPNPNNHTDPKKIEQEIIVQDLTDYEEELCHLSQLE